MDGIMWLGLAVVYLVVAGVGLATALEIAPPGHRSSLVLAAIVWPLLLVYAVMRLAVRFLADSPAKEGGSPC